MLVCLLCMYECVGVFACVSKREEVVCVGLYVNPHLGSDH